MNYHSKVTNGEISAPFMTFDVSNVITENDNKREYNTLSRSLIALNEVFDKQNWDENDRF